ncbi:hypothetical protein AKJ57_00105 [candidate division MSBL1 archaeon SCGC-AAA259A05]|uniref:Bacterial Ig-like domain-containing protein n=1 Tax=candidate division MSBL1 archaeon SCGC-AAA259A05 TaxID=1698259 RepID=A0A133UC22_9EURY|nr:hypothetical protein AKJ57_00105 [candidate division MSBL1 archaeon SCGC-AAA259A05]
MEWQPPNHPQKPHVFYGQVEIDGQTMSSGSAVSARVNGTVVAEDQVNDQGYYKLKVDPGYAMVYFYVRGISTETVHIVESGADPTRLDLSITDEGAPSITIDAPSDGALLDESSVTVEGTVTDDVSFYDEITATVAGEEVSLGSDGSFSTEVSLDTGANDITVSAEDFLGNSDSKTVTVTSDTESPSLEVTAPSLVGEKSATIEGTVTDDVASPEKLSVTLNGSSIDLDSEGNFSKEKSLVTGSNSFTIIAEDQVGHTAEESVTIVSDTTGPQVNITSPVSGKVVKTDTMTIKATVSDDVASYNEITVTLDEETVPLSADGTFEKEVSVASGQNTFEVTAEDPVGNSGSADVSVTRDTTDPSITISEPEEGLTTTKDTVTVSGTVEDDIASYDEITLEVAGTSVEVHSDGSFSTTVTLEMGKQKINVKAWDGVNNSNSKSRTVERTTGTPWALYIGVAVVIAIVLAGIAIWRRRAGPSGGGM